MSKKLQKPSTDKSREYWLKRQNQRLTQSERNANEVAYKLSKVYKDSEQRVNDKIENILKNYSKDIGMSKHELKELLSKHDLEKILQDMTDDLLKTGTYNRKNMEWVKGNYLKRLSREEGIKLQLENERRIIEAQELKLLESGIDATINQTYSSLTKDLTGKVMHLDETAKKSILENRWVGDKNYSDRVWKNTNTLFDDISTKINSAVLSGQSIVLVTNEIAERYKVERYRAETLVRTEVNYFENATELQSYQDMGVTHYFYFATRDMRTSIICSVLDGQRFAVKDAKPGENYPPMHPNCRSGTLPDLDFNSPNVYRNPLTREMEETKLDYDEYIQSLRVSSGADIVNSALKKEKNWSVDNKQYQKYRKILGDEIPKTLSKFQDMKYNKVEKWELTKDHFAVKSKLKDGRWSSTINNEKQKPHNELTREINKSYLFNSIDAQNLLDEYAGTGYLEKSRKGKTHKEVVDVGYPIGIDINSGKVTTLIKIHHSKKRTHIVPFSKKL